MSKYGNRITIVDGLRFDSQKEANRWCELQLLQRIGEITNLTRQVRYKLEVNGVLVCSYVADFEYDEGRLHICEDSKGGVRTPDYIIKRKLMRACHGIEIRET